MISNPLVTGAQVPRCIVIFRTPEANLRFDLIPSLQSHATIERKQRQGNQQSI